MSKPAVICDIDGSLVDVSGIRHYVTDDPDRRNFEKFHSASSYAPPMPMVAELVRALHGHGFTIVILTARMEKWKYITKAWLSKWDVPYDLLGMRADKDERRDDYVKLDLYTTLRAMGYEPVLAIDDNPIVIDLWRSLDIPTVVVPGWDLTSVSGSSKVEA